MAVFILAVIAFTAACGAAKPSPTAVPGGQPSPSATTTASPGLPTPDASGVYRGLTIEQAKQLVPFRLTEPTRVPAALVFEGVDVSAWPPPPAGGTPTPPDTAVLYYRPAADPTAGRGVQLWESLHNTTPAASTGATQTVLTIEGKQVTKTVQPNVAGVLVTSYAWQTGDIYYAVMGIVEPPVTGQDLEELVAAMSD